MDAPTAFQRLSEIVEMTQHAKLAEPVAARLRDGATDREDPFCLRRTPWAILRNFVEDHSEAWAATTTSGIAYHPARPKRLVVTESLLLAVRSAFDCGSDGTTMLATMTARVVEDEAWYQARRRAASRWGLEDVLDERMELRMAIHADAPELFVSARECLAHQLAAPAGARASLVTRLGRPLMNHEEAWLDAERKAGTLEWIRDHKFDSDGNIEWYVDTDARWGFVIRSHGLPGRHVVCDRAEAPGTTVRQVALDAAIGALSRPAEAEEAAVEVVLSMGPGEVRHTNPLVTWRVSVDGKASMEEPVPLLAECWSVARNVDEELRQRPRVDVIAEDGGVVVNYGSERYAEISAGASAEEVIQFLELLRRVSDSALLHSDLGNLRNQSPSLAVAATDAYVSITQQPHARRDDGGVRLVYLESGLSHQMGGLPEVGRWYLAEMLERRGQRADRSGFTLDEFLKRLPEFLGAKVVGFATFLTNVDNVQQAIDALRSAGFKGYVVLGGPQAIHIDQLQELWGWDAIIRGEAEEALPETIDILDDFSAGSFAEALEKCAGLSGIAIRVGAALILCDTARRNKVKEIRCPLPYRWSPTPRGTLQMNFTRGCPYECEFCPNHQGKQFRSAAADSMLQFSLLAVANGVGLAEEPAARVREWLAGELGERDFPIELALFLWNETAPSRDKAEELLALLGDPSQSSDASAATPSALVESWEPGPLSRHQVRELLLHLYLALLLDDLDPVRHGSFSPIIIETSEDNTLVNDNEIRSFLSLRRKSPLGSSFVFNPGQNSIKDLVRGKQVRTEFIDLLTRDNPCSIAFGVDGPSNPVLRQNLKPNYTIGDAIAVNAELSRSEVVVENNYILLAPETRFEEAVEAMMLFVVSPIPWRMHDTAEAEASNVRVSAEIGTLATDEALVLYGSEAITTDWHVPFRDTRTTELLRRNGLSNRTASKELASKLWHILLTDEEVIRVVPQVLDRWEGAEDDPEVLAVARYLRAGSDAASGATIIARLQEMAKDLGRLRAELHRIVTPDELLRRLLHPSAQN